MAQWWADAFSSILSAFASWFQTAGDISITQYQGSSLWQVEGAIGAVVALAGTIWAGARTAWTHSGQALATALTGLAKAALAILMVFAVVSTLMEAANEVTDAVISQTWGSTSGFTSFLGGVSGATSAGALPDTLVFLFSLIGVVITFLLWVEMLARSAGILVVTMTTPIGAAGLVSEHTAKWWRKLVSAELALIVVKPVIALVMATGFLAINGASGVQGAIVGLIILAGAAFAWPVVARLFSFFDGQVASLGVAGALGFAGGMGGQLVGNLATGQPMWQTMELAGMRNPSPTGPPLGGSGGAESVGASPSTSGGPTAGTPGSGSAAGDGAEAAGSAGVAGAGGGGAAGVGGGAGAAGVGSVGASAGGAEAGAAGGAGMAAGAVAGPAGLVVAGALEGAKKVVQAGPRLMSHAGDMAGVGAAGGTAGGGRTGGRGATGPAFGGLAARGSTAPGQGAGPSSPSAGSSAGATATPGSWQEVVPGPGGTSGASGGAGASWSPPRPADIPAGGPTVPPDGGTVPAGGVPAGPPPAQGGSTGQASKDQGGSN